MPSRTLGRHLYGGRGLQTRLVWANLMRLVKDLFADLQMTTPQLIKPGVHKPMWTGTCAMPFGIKRKDYYIYGDCGLQAASGATPRKSRSEVLPSFAWTSAFGLATWGEQADRGGSKRLWSSWASTERSRRPRRCGSQRHECPPEPEPSGPPIGPTSI